jgi:glutamine cyclotransferase
MKALYTLSLFLHIAFASIDVSPIPLYHYQHIASHPHQPQFFTQGLTYHQGHLYESSGLYGQSKLIQYQHGLLLPKISSLSPQIFAEGIASNQSSLFQLTWKEVIALEHTKNSNRIIPQFNQGWGLCFDGGYFIQSDGSNRLYYRHQDLSPAFHINVHFKDSPVGGINDLMIYKGFILANIWYQDIIIIILPYNGEVIGYINCKDLRTITPYISSGDVLNGLCLLPNGNILLTGKNWTYLYEIKLLI